MSVIFREPSVAPQLQPHYCDSGLEFRSKWYLTPKRFLLPITAGNRSALDKLWHLAIKP